jgi:taste receptor type 2
MESVIQSTFTTILSVEFIMGNLGNGFIALVNCMDWVKRRKMSSVDRILTALAISRIAMLWLFLLNMLISALYPALEKTGKVMRVINTAWVVTDYFNIWLAAGLSIFYFLKIARFSNSIFFYLKWRVKRVVSMTLIVSLPLLVFHIVLINKRIDIWIEESKRNMSYTSSSRTFAQFSRFILITTIIFLSIPFLVSLTAFLLLIFSLWKHHKKMQHNAQGSRDVSTMAHIKALKTVIAFLLLYTIFFLTLALKLCSFGFLEKFQIIWVFNAAEIVFPSVHSCILILGNSKLRQVSISVLLWLKCRCKDVRLSYS